MKMKNGEIMKKTMPFVWTRFGLYAALNVGLILYFLVWFLILGSLIEGGNTIGYIVLLVAVVIGFGIYAKISDYFGYLVKAAHIAVIGELAVYGQVPEGTSIVEYGKEQVKKRFIATNVFYAIDKLVSGAVKQIQNMVSRIGGIFGNSDAVKNIVTIINTFIAIVLGYVDEAVLARIFIKKDEGAWKGAADGVVLYFQSWKAILKNALMLVLIVVGFTVVTGGFFLGIIYLVANLITNSVGGFLIFFFCVITAILLQDVLKQSFLDSYITISVVNKYMEVTINETPAVDLYEKAKGWSKSFKELCGNAEKEISQGVGNVAAAPVAAGVAAAQPQVQPMQQSVVQPQMQPMQQPVVQPQVQPIQQPVVQPQMQPMQQSVVQPEVQPMQKPVVQPQVQPMQQPVVQPEVQPVVQPQVQPVVQPQQPVQGIDNQNPNGQI